MSKLLLDEHPLLVLPSLAQAIGLNEAIVLQQVHYWLLENKKRKKLTHYRDGAWWVYNTYEDWQNDNFPFWSLPTIQRTVASLEKKGLLRSGRLSEIKQDRKKWYTIDYEAVAELELPVSIISNCDDASYQIDTMHDIKLIPCIKEAETNTETTTETMRGALKQAAEEDFQIAENQQSRLRESHKLACGKPAIYHAKSTTESTAPAAAEGALFNSICEACKLNPDDLTNRRKQEVLDVEDWLRKKYPKAKAESLGDAVNVFGRWFTNEYWKGKTPQPLWIQEHWEKFRLDVKDREARQAKRAG
jgi:hypothetical protein